MMNFVLAGGCFWCLDSSFMQFAGVADVEVGYMGGAVENPGYDAVCSGTTGHAEVAKIVFDETVIPPEVILDMFFTIHDPRQLNRQGNDVGTQYRSAMYFIDDAQKSLFEAALQRASEHWDGGLVTELSPIETFWPGEEYHQDFFAKNPNQGYCNAVVSPKMAKARAAFSQYLR
jgi:peptide-methionine (S)-S-oxide reductase